MQAFPMKKTIVSFFNKQFWALITSSLSGNLEPKNTDDENKEDKEGSHKHSKSRYRTKTSNKIVDGSNTKVRLAFNSARTKAEEGAPVQKKASCDIVKDMDILYSKLKSAPIKFKNRGNDFEDIFNDTEITPVNQTKAEQ